MQGIHLAKTAILQPNDGKPAYAYREKERKLMSAVSWCRANAMLLIALLAAGITVVLRTGRGLRTAEHGSVFRAITAAGAAVSHHP